MDNERLAALERVAEAARKLETAVACKDRLLDRPQQALRDALLALDALSTQTPKGAMGKVVQITSIPGDNDGPGGIHALTNDGQIWARWFNRDQWERVPAIASDPTP